MATFTDYHLAAPVLKAFANLHDLRKQLTVFPEKISAAEVRVDKALTAFETAAAEIAKIDERITAHNAARSEYFNAVNKHKKAEREYAEWNDLKRRYDAGEFYLQELVDAGPKSNPNEVKIPAEVPPLDSATESEFLEKFQKVLDLATAVNEAALAANQLRMGKSSVEEQIIMAESAAASSTKNGLAAISGFKCECKHERVVAEAELAELDEQHAATEKRREELRTKLGLVERIAKAFK